MAAAAAAAALVYLHLFYEVGTSQLEIWKKKGNQVIKHTIVNVTPGPALKSLKSKGRELTN